MSHAFALTFDQPTAAERAFVDAERWVAARIVTLDDACIAIRAAGQTVLRRPPLWTPGDGHGRHLLDRFVARLRARQPTPGLNQTLLERFGRSMSEGSSALIVSVRRLDPSGLRPHLQRLIVRHRARVARLATDAEVAPFDDVPTAADLAMAAMREIEARAASQRAKSSQATRANVERLARFGDPSGAADALRGLVQHCRTAAGQGRSGVLGYQFPSAVLTDRGRAVHAGDPSWPRTLTGEPHAVYALVERHLLARGYRVEAAILDYPDGLLGDVGLFVRWA